MWSKGWRERVWSNLNQPWDLIIIGGGITGAGILHHAVSCGLKALLVEANDFAFGTSSRSSKLVHGGLRYILQKQYKVTQESVREREWLLREATGLVTKLGFIFPNYQSYHAKSSTLKRLVAVYDLLAPKWDHRWLNRGALLKIAPVLNSDGLRDGFLYYDAAMDDSRVLLRVLREAVRAGGTALNYARVEKLLRTADGRVCGFALKDMGSPDGRTVEIQSRVVVSAVGAWSDELRAQLNAPARLRRLRGSHLIFTRERMPVERALTVLHPKDRRAMFVIPWEGTTVVGTTDIDQPAELDTRYAEPFASKDEIDYILQMADFLIPEAGLKEKDVISTFSGLRPIIHGGAATPSGESRAHAIWDEEGLITITGGKYTTFRIMSRQTVEKALIKLGKLPVVPRKRVFEPLTKIANRLLDAATLLYLSGRHGSETANLVDAAHDGELQRIDGLPNVWAELRWAAREEGVVHLADLLLRRVRIGMLLPNGAQDIMDKIRAIVQPELGWDDARWATELASYRGTWQRYYSPAPG
jgi:glycerol-3-phosphate dehydrogenase